MTEPRPELERALQHVAPQWDAARTERTLEGAKRKRAARQARVRVAASLAAVAVLGGGAALWLQATGQERAGAPGPEANDRVVSFSDGSRAELLDPQAQVVVASVTPTAIDVQLAAGSARFEVAPRPERRFRVRSGDVTVQVLGTAFDLTRVGARTHVQVLHGRVAVQWPTGATELTGGEAGWFPRAEPVARSTGTQVSADAANDTNGAPDEDRPISSGIRSARGAQPQSWRQHAEQGDFSRAYALLERDRIKVADDVDELLLAADAARLSGHPAQALPFLHKVVELHAQDPRAPLAAFTLGSVLMNQLGRPREAEAAYARALGLSPPASLAQDALARQVEAAHRAGDPSHARALALEYLDRYPHGRRVQAVRRFGGLP